MGAPRIVTFVRRVFSETPLAKSYETALAGERRSRRPIPWTSFKRDEYPEAALALASDANLRLAEGEYHAVGLFGRIASGIAMAAAPFDIVAAATRVSSDEIRHADYCARFSSLCAGNDVTLCIDRAALAAAAPVLPGVAEVDFLVAKYAAAGETLAAALLLACRKRAKDPVARALFSALLSDEIHHARLGWYYLAWRAPSWSHAEQQVIADRLGEFIADVEHVLWYGRDAPESARAAADALGVLDSESQRDVVREVMEDDIVPGLDALGLGASHAWKARRRGGERGGSASRGDFVFVGRDDVGHREGIETSRDGDVVSVTDRAAAFLAAQVAPDGSIFFSMDASSRAKERFGPLAHGRAAIAMRALSEHGGYPRVAELARARLAEDITLALSGRDVASWPNDDPALVAATLALALLAGIDVKAALIDRGRAPEVALTPWYAAEVVAALGKEAPDALWAACVRGIDTEPWAPWTSIAARARGDTATRVRLEAILADSVDMRGAVSGPNGPETARTAVVVEALAPFTSPLSRSASERACNFLQTVQLTDRMDRGGATDGIDGAFPVVPGATLLRTDVTAHALLAFLAWERRTR